MLFAGSIDVRKGKGVLVEATITNFKKMYDVCDVHAAREYHKDTIAVCDAFVERMCGKRESVLIQLRERARETIHNNRKKLCSIKDNCLVWSAEHCSLWVIMVVAQIWKVHK